MDPFHSIVSNVSFSLFILFYSIYNVIYAYTLLIIIIFLYVIL